MMMTKQELTQMVSEEMARCLEEARSTEHLMPIALVIGKKEKVVIGLRFENDKEKVACQRAVRLAARKLRAKAVLFRCEAWTRVVDLRQDYVDVRPKDAPDRQEAIVVAAMAPGVSAYQIQAFERHGSMVVRKGDVVSLGESVFDNWLDGIWVQ